MDDELDNEIDLPFGAEDESDLHRLKQLDVSTVSVTGTDWTTETLLTQMAKGNIELNPRFQRRDAWELKRKSLFIESLILGLPVPQIVLAERIEARGKYIVLDGKQRLLCLRQFVAKPSDAEYKSFKLGELEIRPDLDGKSFLELQEDFQFRDVITAFENQPIRTVVVRNWKSESLLFHVFLRLNRGSKPLSPQELRQALHPGPFLDFADEYSTSSRAVRDILNLKEPDFRMRDIELIIRYLSFRHLLPGYRGNLKDFLDKACAFFNKSWDTLAAEFAAEMNEFEYIHTLVKRIFGPKFNYSKWSGGRYERRFNRAVFDVVIASFCAPNIRRAIENDPSKVEPAFKSLCEEDPKFIEAIERTTKSLESTRYRFEAFFKCLETAYEINADVPTVGQ
jgi:Protein of unknown function DUF262